MAKRKTRTKSKIAEMVKVISENNHRRIQAIPNSGDILVAAGYAEYVEDETEDTLAKLTNRGVDNAQVKSDSTVDAPLSQTNHSNVKLPRTTHLPTEDADEPSPEDDIEAIRKKLPKSLARLRVWKATWRKIKGEVEKGRPVSKISIWLKGLDTYLPHSREILSTIIEAGEKGLLD